MCRVDKYVLKQLEERKFKAKLGLILRKSHKSLADPALEATFCLQLRFLAIIYITPKKPHHSVVQSNSWNKFVSLKLRVTLVILEISLLRFSSVQFSRSVVSNSLWPLELQHTRHPCPSPTPRVHSNLCPSSRWCHPIILSSVVRFSSCPQFFPASESFHRKLISCIGTSAWLTYCMFASNVEW